jgi:large subunit ribosomal protein L2
MAIKKFRPITPARRFMSVMDTSDITSKPTVRSLLVRVKAAAGRNNNGRITSRHKEAGAKKLYRIIDFKRNKFDIPAVIETIEYDPNRSAHLALLKYGDGARRYIIAPLKNKVGDPV